MLHVISHFRITGVIILCGVVVGVCVVIAKARNKATTETAAMAATTVTAANAPQQRSLTAVATPISIPTENNMDNIPMATPTGIRRMVTVDAVMTMPPTPGQEIEALPVAVAQPVGGTY